MEEVRVDRMRDVSERAAVLRLRVSEHAALFAHAHGNLAGAAVLMLDADAGIGGPLGRRIGRVRETARDQMSLSHSCRRRRRRSVFACSRLSAASRLLRRMRVRMWRSTTSWWGRCRDRGQHADRRFSVGRACDADSQRRHTAHQPLHALSMHAVCGRQSADGPPRRPHGSSSGSRLVQ